MAETKRTLGERFGYFLVFSVRWREGGVRGAGRGVGRFFNGKFQEGGVSRVSGGGGQGARRVFAGHFFVGGGG